MRLTPVSPHVRVGLLAVLAVAAAGCNGEKKPIVPVQGKILFADGKALPAGTRLVFNPAEGATGTATGVTAEDGSFQVTHVSGAAGAEVGKYVIQLAAPVGDSGSFFRIVPKAYYEGGAFPVEVTQGMAPLDLKVGRR